VEHLLAYRFQHNIASPEKDSVPSLVYWYVRRRVRKGQSKICDLFVQRGEV
jgi:hypothetical protein